MSPTRRRSRRDAVIELGISDATLDVADGYATTVFALRVSATTLQLPSSRHDAIVIDRDVACHDERVACLVAVKLRVFAVSGAFLLLQVIEEADVLDSCRSPFSPRHAENDRVSLDICFPTLFFLFDKKASSISTTRPGPPKFPSQTSYKIFDVKVMTDRMTSTYLRAVSGLNPDRIVAASIGTLSTTHLNWKKTLGCVRSRGCRRVCRFCSLEHDPDKCGSVSEGRLDRHRI